MEINQWAASKVNEHVETIKFYISDGMTKEWAIETVRNSTTIGPKYWAKVLEIVDSGHYDFVISI